MIPNAVPYLGGNEWAYIKECLDTNWVSSAGPFVDRFERAMADRVGAAHGVATASGTAALHVALLLAGVEPGDEVLVPALTFIASANAVRYCGAFPTLLDSEAESWGLDPAKTEEFLEKCCERHAAGLIDRDTGRRVRAILPVHLYGHPVDLDPLLELSRRFELPLVEDAAESLGARYKGRPVGVDGLVGCLSFNGNKIVTSGGGGMIVTNDAELARRARHLTTQAREPGDEWVHRDLGFNYRLTSLHAALGLAQVEQLDAFVADKRATARAYDEALARLGGATPLGEAPWAFSNFWMYSVLLDPRRYGDIPRLVRLAAKDGIQLRPLWYPLHRQPALADCRAYRVEVADRLHAVGVSLPCSVGITEDERARVIAFLEGVRP